MFAFRDASEVSWRDKGKNRSLDSRTMAWRRQKSLKCVTALESLGKRASVDSRSSLGRLKFELGAIKTSAS